MADFSTVVKLYRLSLNPQYDGRSFSATVELTSELFNIIKDINSSSVYGRFEDVEIDDDIVDLDELSGTNGLSINYTFIPAKNGAEKFYQKKNDFINTNSIKKGVIPENFLITEIDYYSLDANKPDFILKVERICSVIKSLSEIAHFHDLKSESSNYRLVFVKNSDSKSTSIVLETSVTPRMLDCELINDSILKELIGKDTSVAHYSEKIGTFRNTLVEFIVDKDIKFSDLIYNWQDFIRLFENNLSTYMSGFSFHKARKDVATAEADFAEKISKITNELTAKILSIPISLIASLGILKLNDKNEMIIVFSGITLTSFFIYLILKNQKQQLSRITHAKDMVFKPFISSNKQYPEDLKKDISDAINDLDISQDTCSKTISILMFLSWLPTSVAIGIFISKLFK
ncbi:hypothetical protein [Serratia quinivorans]|uniref:hypothetical protein n=1 Tax=Serratia quinivorans TaxID=137545 RepID=UPI00217AE6FF|nr:hypothetical protein [Serratia quinivorans]CAI0968875.1 Uncharacterised protein [Serratia quinivorans]CAI2150406.1 Uncharacterised protein [Serratia quinivorans]